MPDIRPPRLDAMTNAAPGDRKRVLFLAQTPPPHHGQSAVAALVRDVFETDAGMIVDQRWRGGAQSNTEIGKKTLGKYLGFARLLIELFTLFIIGRRYDIAYLGIAPWAHTAFRDAILIGVAKLLANRTWVHAHGAGLPELIGRPGPSGVAVRTLLAGTELIAITEDVARDARKSGIFARILPLANMASDPGDPAVSTATTLTIVCLGNLDPRKGVLDFVDVVSTLAKYDDRVRGVIIGGPTVHLDVEDVKKRAAGHGAESAIQVTGWVSEERKNALLAEADIFLYLSRHDLAPVVLIEALAHGCVPIVLDTGGIAEMAGPELAANVLEFHKDTVPITRVRALIENYLNDADALARDKARARKRYLNAFTPKIFQSCILRFLANQDDTDGKISKSTPNALVDQTS